MIRSTPTRLAFLAVLTPLFGGIYARAEESVPDCLTEAEVREVVNNRVVIPQIQALRVARSTTGGDAIRASLCRSDGRLIYVFTMLALDGKLQQVRIQGETGEAIPVKKE